MKRKKGLLLSILMVKMSLMANAYDAEIDGIYYNFSGDEAEVTYKVENAYDNYSGDVIIPESVTYDGKEYRVTSINEEAFKECSKLTSVTIPNSITTIGGSAFSGCTLLTTIAFPEGVAKLGEFALAGCSSLSSVNLPKSLISIGNFAFAGCSNLISIDIPTNIKHMGVEVFSLCRSLSSVTIPEGIERIYSRTFRGCSSLSSVTIPESVEKIEMEAFYDCTSLASLKIPDNVKEIEKKAFLGCTSLSCVTFSEKLEFIGSSSFAGCLNLTTIVCEAQNPPIHFDTLKDGSGGPADVFYKVNKQNCKLYVPKGCEEAYRASDLWKDFNIVEMEMGISEMNNKRVKSEKYNDAIYDLSGRKMFYVQSSMFNGLKKGLYIQNGRKVSVK